MIKAYAAMAAHNELVEFEYDPGKLNTNEVEINVKFCGICHSDISMINNDWGISQYPLVPGHEIVGEICAIGSGVSNLNIGDMVGLGWHCAYCNNCHLCNSSNHNLCANSTATIVNHHGGFAKKVRAESNSVIILPKGLCIESAGPLFCAGITVFNPIFKCNLTPGSKAAVIGIGGLGHLAVKFLKAWGCEVTAFTSNDNKIPAARSLGADHVVNHTNTSQLEQLYGTFDFVLSTVNVKLNWDSFINILAPLGRLHLVGAALEPLNINAMGLIMKHTSISGSPVGSPDTIAKMLDFAMLHDIQPTIEKFALSEVNHAIKKIKSGDIKHRAVLVVS